MDKDNETANVQFHVRITSAINKLLEQRAEDEGIPKNQLVTKALSLYLTKDVMDESLLIAKMTQMQKEVDKVELSIEMLAKLTMEYYQYFFLLSPDPEQIPKDQQQIRLNKADQMVQNMIKGFRRRIKQMPDFCDQILGSMLEEKVE